jgi:hypothetical protein
MADTPLTLSLNETIVQAVARLVDDAGATREPSHSDLESLFNRSGLAGGDPHLDPAVRVGKQKRVRSTLQWAMGNDEAAGVRGITSLIATVRGFGGFRPESPHFCGADCISTCIDAFEGEAIELTSDGLLRVRNLAGLSGRPLSNAIRPYVNRAQKGFLDSVLLAGTDKDLIEATAAHVLTERYGALTFPPSWARRFTPWGWRHSDPSKR